MHRKLIKIATFVFVCGAIMSACKSETISVLPEVQTITVTDENQQTTEDNTIQDVAPEVDAEYPLDTNVEAGIVIDLTLADAIRYELGYDKEQMLTYEDLEGVTYIGAFYEAVNSLKGISLLVNLKELRINSGNIEDISELGLLENINTIDISNCYIKEIPDLSGCVNLETLYLLGNLIEDVSPLCKLETLKYISLADNRINSIAPLEYFVNVESFGIDNNCIIDYEVISSNTILINAINEGSQCTYEQCMEVEKRAKAIVETFQSDISELEMEIMIYQYVIDNMEFETKDRPMSAFAYHAITEGIGVCGDYAQLFCILARHAGLEAYVCGSETHAWNIIKIEDKYYHCDALWDEFEEEWIYFNKGEEYIITVPDHTYDIRKYPNCK